MKYPPPITILTIACLLALAPALEAVDISGVTNLLAAGRNDGNVQMFDGDTGASLGDFDPSGGSGEIGELLFHNNQWYAAQGGSVYQWDLDGTNPSQVISGIPGFPLGLATDGSSIFTAGDGGAGIREYDASFAFQGQIFGTNVAGLTLGPDGNLVSGYWDGKVRHIELPGGGELTNWDVNLAGFPEYHPDGDLYHAPLVADDVSIYNSPLHPTDPLGFVEAIPVPADGGALAQIAFLGPDTMFVSRKDGTGIFRFDRNAGTWSLNAGGGPNGAWATRATQTGTGVATNFVSAPPEDSDGDGIVDATELSYDGITNLDQLGTGDFDQDGLNDPAEVNTHRTDPTVKDSDGDGLEDGPEVNTHGTNPTRVDSDGDGLNDREEIETYETNPNLADTDNDGFSDKEEVDANTDPKDSNDFPAGPVLPANLLAAGQGNGVLKLYNADTGAFLFDFEAPASPVGDVGTMLYHNNQWYATSADHGKVFRWNLDGTNPTEVITGIPGFPIGIVTDGTSIFVGSNGGGGGIHRYNAETFAFEDTIFNTPVGGLALGPDGNLVSGFWGDGKVRHVQLDGTELTSWDVNLAGYPAYNPDGDLYHAPLVADEVTRYNSPLHPTDPLDLVEFVPIPADARALAQIAFLGPDTLFVRRKDGTGIYRFDRVGGAWTQNPGGDAPFAVQDQAGAGLATNWVSTPSRIALDVNASGANLVFTWDSRAGKVYDLLSETDLSIDPTTWPIWDGNEGIAATPDENTLTIPRPADSERYFVIAEKDAPPVSVFSENFESGQGLWEMGGDPGDAPGTNWELGAPTNVGPTAANGGTNCFGTNLAENTSLNCEIWLRSPPIDLTAAVGATLNFSQFRDIETGFDFGNVNVLDADDDSQLAPIPPSHDGQSGDWEDISKSLPVAALGKTIRIEFRLVADDLDVGAFAGWYIDDVEVTVP